MRILGLSGSLRTGSYNTGLLVAAARRAPDGVEVVAYEGIRDLPFYDADIDGDSPPPAAAAFRAAIAEADALLFATPEYNATMPALVKNAVDWASRPAGDGVIRNVVSAVVGASTGQFGGVWAQEDLRKSLRTAGARVLDAGVAVAKAASAVDEDGVLVSEAYLGQLDAVLRELVAEARISAETRAAHHRVPGA